MRTAVKLTGIGMLAFLTGCSTLSALNPFAKEDPRTAPAPLVEFKPTMSVRTAWSVRIGKAKSFSFAPAFANGNLFAAAADGSVFRIDPASGKEIWRIKTGTRLSAGVGSDGLTVAVAGEKGTLLAFDAEGKLRWKAQASSEILSAPAVGQGLVVVRSIDNRIAAYDLESGVRRWAVQRNAPSLTLRTAPGITISGTNAFVALPGGRLLALALSNGGPRWEVPVGDPRGTTELERIADVSGSPVVVGSDVCAVAYQGKVACFDAVTGNPRWAKPISSDVGLAVDERFVFVADEHGAVSAFTRDTGAGLWRNDKLANRRLSIPVSFGRAVIVGDRQGYIHFLSREDGSFLARVKTDGSQVIPASPLVVNSNVIFQTQAGTLVALTTD